MYGIWGIPQGLDGAQQDLLHGDVQNLEKRVGILAGFVDTTLSATPRQSISAMCASAIPAAATAADQPTTVSSALALHALTLPAPNLQAHTSMPQHQPSRNSSRLSMRPSGSATSPSSRWDLFNARIHQSPEALNRRKGKGNRRISIGRRLFQWREDIKDRHQEGTV